MILMYPNRMLSYEEPERPPRRIKIVVCPRCGAAIAVEGAVCCGKAPLAHGKALSRNCDAKGGV